MRPLPPDHLPFLILQLEVLGLSFVIREIYIYIFAGSKVAFWEYFPRQAPFHSITGVSVDHSGLLDAPLPPELIGNSGVEPRALGRD